METKMEMDEISKTLVISHKSLLELQKCLNSLKLCSESLQRYQVKSDFNINVIFIQFYIFILIVYLMRYRNKLFLYLIRNL